MIVPSGASISATWAGVARRAAAALLAPILILALAGCQDAPGEGQDSGPPNPLFYEIASADGAVEGWMVGTIHALPDGTIWRTPEITAAINKADLLLVEIADLDDKTALPQIFAQLATTPGQPPLDRRLPAKLHTNLDALLDRGGLDAAQFTSVETWAAALTLAQVTAEGDPANGVDRALIADFDGRPVREFEGARVQLSIFDRLPEADQRALLAAVVRDADQASTEAARLRRAWRSGDAAAIEAASQSGILADAEVRSALLTARNRDWVAKLLPQLEAEPRPLIAVGAAHLVGPEGLAALLEAQGYRVRRLP
ncbi:MAG TPA: TraB/GumN family protein [Erythrobacter sp.]|nr:TraB/GumN family protein [Erythrobacter sp.]